MRFPRTNLTDAGDFSSGIETDLPEVIPGEKPAAPIWQSNFSLAPNVRFTRTPETLISKRRAPDEPARDDSQMGQQAIRIEPVAVDVPFDIYLPEPDELPAAPQTIELQPSLVPDAPAAPAFRATAELSSISDFAFWEVMAFEEAEPVRAPAVISFPKAETAPESITSLFRIMEWRPGRPSVAPVASRPVSPAATVSAKPAPRPPAAIFLERPRRTPVEAPVRPAPQPALTSPIAPVPQAASALPVASAPQAAPAPQRTPPVAAVLPSPRLAARPEKIDASGYEFPPRALLQEPPERLGEIMSQETLEQNAGLLESVLEDFGIKGEIIHVRPGPVVTLYEFEPAPGVKSSRVIGLADDIARSMSALSARVAVVPGRNVIGIELPNVTRETVYFREMIESQDFEKSGYKLALGLGKTIGGEPVIAELAKMPHLLVAGTTGSGKSVAINTMILSLLYRMTPEQCRLIMVDPKMLELSVYDGIPHLLTPVVTDPKKAVMALKWAVREMEERYRKMSRLGVRNIDGYNDRVAQARDKGETIHVMVQVGFDKGTGAPIEENQALDLTPMPYIVVIVDEMADLMMVAGKEIEGAIQRLAQMARAAGIHLIMATQRPSVDVITGTIKANFPTRISFQVTSKIDSRTILGEQGAEQLLGQGDMLHMQGGGRISRVHGPFVSDVEVEKVVAHLKTQGRPEYLDTVTADEEEEPEEEEAGAVFDKSAMASEDGNELYEQAVKVVMRDKKCSTSYIQRRLGIGYNRAASLVERMEKEGLVGPANHVGKREIVSGRGDGE
ncbi:DNA segregation ATPase, FtsK/SpoIIIE family [Rhizobium leguminosarum bv. trifolii WSM597]|uniref:Cell divisionFtsK/SpoIIIE n=2 Tax=Rhizobium leguminosarum bv. trifolii TaxID=386 RepID=A0ABF7QT08_RHILW|nr:DNA translocase FtsK [Rhizobium leguminosarum]ACI57366.1 cell divisionFtsK/SpoIIIE [Rhizobium leguminosarum bv. trifolii WSM2304]EJB04736.1 DNA segregation ATPase, FtsK/SpoIIIE family [Rhizobium leguminosarum bv. trifolii WSM597]